jgi:iron complex outermembrane receptor protein
MYFRLRSRSAARGGALAVVLALAAPWQAYAQQGTIRGRVTDEVSGAPISGATVQIVGTAMGVFTDQNGGYSLSVRPGDYTVRAATLGYAAVQRPVTVEPGATVTLNFSLAVSALAIDEIVAVGSRTARTATETPVPVDVIPALEIQQAGEIETNQILRTLAPSFNASHQTISDGSDHVNPASLRGLGPDQTLVLINGKRRHSSALVHVNGTFGRGTVGVDLNAIPASAIERIEILRDGASAQYGSDAIAGVINIVLKEQYDKVYINASGGFNAGTDVSGFNPGDPARSGEIDGETASVNANFGFPIGGRGFFNITADYLSRNRTNRSGIYTGAIFTGDGSTDAAELSARGLTREDFSMKIGQSDATVGALFFNSAFPLGETGEFYAFGGLTNRNGLATGFYRLPRQEERVVPELFPNGFLPEIRTSIDDNSLTAGLRGTKLDWDVDVSLTTGYNRFKFNITNSNNASQGASSPTDFDAGGFRFRQTTANVDAVKLLDTGGRLKSLSLVLGAEYRLEQYRLFAGEPASYLLGNGGDIPGVDFDTTSGGSPKNPGSQVFPGFQPDNEADRSRNSIGAYAGLETEINDEVLVDATVRFEDYSDFGTQWTGKLAARWYFIPDWSLRGAVSNGFRAPSLPQVWFNNVSIQFVFDQFGNLEPARVLTAKNKSAVARAFGVPALDAETSINYSAGITARPLPNLTVTVDGYFIQIDDRIVLSSRFSSTDGRIGDQVSDILAPFADQGVSQAQFFANAVDTETKGVDIVAAWALGQVGPGDLMLSTAWNFTETEVTATNVPQSMADKFAGGDLTRVTTILFNREERNRLETALPTEKGTFQARYSIPRWTFTGRSNYYGSIQYRPDCGNDDPNLPCDNDEDFSAKILFDLDVGYEFIPGATLSVGATNIFNTLPDKHEVEANWSSGRFPFSRRVTQYGLNGGYYYASLRLAL